MKPDFKQTGLSKAEAIDRFKRIPNGATLMDNQILIKALLRSKPAPLPSHPDEIDLGMHDQWRKDVRAIADALHAEPSRHISFLLACGFTLGQI